VELVDLAVEETEQDPQVLLLEVELMQQVAVEVDVVTH
jgi:hypothetical protein